MSATVLNSVRLPSFRRHNTSIKPRNCFLVWDILVLELISKLAHTYMTPRGSNHASPSSLGLCAFWKYLRSDKQGRPPRSAKALTLPNVRWGSSKRKESRVLNRLITTSSVCPRAEWLRFFKLLIYNESLLPVMSITGNRRVPLGQNLTKVGIDFN